MLLDIIAMQNKIIEKLIIVRLLQATYCFIKNAQSADNFMTKICVRWSHDKMIHKLTLIPRFIN